jgi:RNA polymerase sigma-70 factor (ECF subfamily)
LLIFAEETLINTAMTQIQFDSALMGMQSKLRYYALSLTTDSEKADDLVQETFLKALTNRDKFAINTNFNAWVYTIMKNTFINDYRRNIKARSTYDTSAGVLPASLTAGYSYPSPDSSYRTAEINRTIRSLEDDYRIPFTMFLEGFKYKEIADELDLPLGTVKSRIFFTRKKLEKVLGEYSLN